MQVRAPDRSLRQAVRWGDTAFSGAYDIRTTNLQDIDVVSSISLEASCGLFDYKYEHSSTDGTPGIPNSSSNSIYTATFSVTTPPPPQPIEASCSAIPGVNPSGGSIIVTITGGFLPLTIKWEGPSSGELIVYTGGSHTIPDLSSGQYEISIGGSTKVCESLCDVFLAEIIDVELCEGECTSIGEENPSDMSTFSWEPSSEFEDPNIPFQENVCPEETTTYTLYIFDENCSLEETIEYEIEVNEPSEVALKILPGSGGVCGFPVTLEATDGFMEYSWSEGSTGSDNSIIIDAVGTYEVTATDENGCNSIAQLDLTDENVRALIIKGKLEEKGFYGVPINSIVPAFNVSTNLTATTDYAEQMVTIIDGVQNVADELDEFLENSFFDFILPDDKHSYVTNNLSLCDSDPAMFDQLCSELNNVTLGFWAHIWEDPDAAGEGMLYMLGKSPNQEGFATISNYGDMLLQEMLTETGPLEQVTLDKEIIYVFQDDMADFYEFKRTPEEVNRKPEPSSVNCNLTNPEDVIAFNTAQVPIKIGVGAALTFINANNVRVNADVQALMAFHLEGIVYGSYGLPNSGIHTGFKSERSASYYSFPDLTAFNTLAVFQGYIVPTTPSDPSSSWCTTLLEIEESGFQNINWATWTNWGPYPEGGAPHIPDFETSGIGEFYNTGTPYLRAPTCMPPFTFEQYSSPAYILNDHYGHQGALRWVLTSGGYAWIYGAFTQDDPGVESFWQWDCRLMEWKWIPPPMDLSPEFDFYWAVWDAIRSQGHLILDVGGLIPVLGEPIDFINGVWYLYEGNELEAGISFGSVLIPLSLERVAGKLIIKSADTGEDISTVIIDGKKLSDAEHLNGNSLDIINIKSPRKNGDEVGTMFDRMDKSKKVSDEIAEVIINRAQQEKGFHQAWELLSKIYSGEKAEKLWDIDLIEKVLSLKNNTVFMEAIGGADEAAQLANLSKIIKANKFAPCVTCATAGKAHLEHIHLYLGRVENFVVTHNSGATPTEGAASVLNFMMNGQKFQIDEIAQLTRYVDEGIITDVNKFEPHLIDLLGQPILKEGKDLLKNNVGDVLESIGPMGLKLHELKSWGKKTIKGNGGIPGIVNDAGFTEQLKTYIFVLVSNSNVSTPLTVSQNLNYSFDIRKLVNSGPFNSAAEAEQFIKGEMKTLFIQKIDNWIDSIGQLPGKVPQDLYERFNCNNYQELINKINTFDDDIYSFIKVQ